MSQQLTEACREPVVRPVVRKNGWGRSTVEKKGVPLCLRRAPPATLAVKWQCEGAKPREPFDLSSVTSAHLRNCAFAHCH